MYEGYANNAQMGNMAKATAMAEGGFIGAGQGVISKGSEIMEQISTLEALLAENEKIAEIVATRIAPILDMRERPPSAETNSPTPICLSGMAERLQMLAFHLKRNNRQFNEILSRVQL